MARRAAMALTFWLLVFYCAGQASGSVSRAITERLHATSKDPCLDTLPNVAAQPQTGTDLVLVTGGAGFIGSNLVDKLLSLGYTVRVLDDLSSGDAGYLDFGNNRLQFVYGSILDRQIVSKAVQGVKFVVHLAADSKVLPSLKNSSLATWSMSVNSVGTATVLELSKAAGVQKVVYAASSTFYGNREVLEPLREDMAWMPSSPYAASKYAGELFMTTYNTVYGLPTLNLRFFMVYGPRQPTTGAYAIVTGVFAKQALEGHPLTIEGDGTHYRDFIHVDDIVRGIVVGMQSKINGTTINLGTGEVFSVGEVANLISPNQVHVAPRPNDLVGTLANTCRAKSVLNFAAQKKFMSEMPKLLASAKAAVSVLSPWWQRLIAPFNKKGTELSQAMRNDAARKMTPISLPGEKLNLQDGVNWWNLRNDMAALVRARADDGLVIMMPTTSLAGFWALMCNQITSLHRFGIRNWILVALNPSALRACKAVNFPCFNATDFADNDSFASDETTRLGTKGFATASWPKPHSIRGVLRLNYSVVMMDVDIGINSAAAIDDMRKSPHLLQLMVDSRIASQIKHANSGFLMVRPHNLTLQLYDAIIDTIRSTRFTDQSSLQYNLLKFISSSVPNELKSTFLRVLTKHSGFQMGCTYDPSLPSLVAHANCATGFWTKINFLRTVKVWGLGSCHSGAVDTKNIEGLSFQELNKDVMVGGSLQQRMWKLHQCECVDIVVRR